MISLYELFGFNKPKQQDKQQDTNTHVINYKEYGEEASDHISRMLKILPSVKKDLSDTVNRQNKLKNKDSSNAIKLADVDFYKNGGMMLTFHNKVNNSFHKAIINDKNKVIGYMHF